MRIYTAKLYSSINIAFKIILVKSRALKYKERRPQVQRVEGANL